MVTDRTKRAFYGPSNLNVSIFKILGRQGVKWLQQKISTCLSRIVCYIVTQVNCKQPGENIKVYTVLKKAFPIERTNT
jgi:hypothetical protein